MLAVGVEVETEVVTGMVQADTVTIDPIIYCINTVVVADSGKSKIFPSVLVNVSC